MLQRSTDDSSAAKSIIACHGTILRYASKTEQMFSLLFRVGQSASRNAYIGKLDCTANQINRSDNSNFNLNRFYPLEMSATAVRFNIHVSFVDFIQYVITI